MNLSKQKSLKLIDKNDPKHQIGFIKKTKQMSAREKTIKTHKPQTDSDQLCADIDPAVLSASVQTLLEKPVGGHPHVRNSTKLDNKQYSMPFDDLPG